MTVPHPPPKRSGLLNAALLCSLAWVPLLIGIAGQLIGEALGCSVSEAGARPCLVGGIDIGEALATMFVMAWISILATPLLLASIVLWAIVGVRAFVGLLRRAA